MEETPNENTPLIRSEEAENKSWTYWICHPTALGHRLIALFLMCFFGFGSYFCYDNPGALQKEIKHVMGLNTYQFSELYSWYAWPNTVLPILGGYMMDRVFGIRLGTILFTIFTMLGQVLFSLGAFHNSFPTMEIGRFIFGIGGESLAVAQNTYAVKWFKGKELNMVFGFQLSVTRVGSTINFLMIGPLFHWLNKLLPDNAALGWTLMIAGLTCFVSFLCAVILGYMDKRAALMTDSNEEEETAIEDDSSEMVEISDIITYPSILWYLCMICWAYYVAIFSFVSLGQVFFIKKFSLDPSQANFLTGLVYLISAPASPFLGWVIDKSGRNILHVVVSILITIVAHGILAFTFINPYIPIFIMGIGYSLLASALWPIPAYILPNHQLGTAYGLMQAIQNTGMAICTLISGSIVDNFGYLWLEIFFIGWLVVALFCSLKIWLLDFKTNGYVNMSVSQRLIYDSQNNETEERQVTDPNSL